jgi:hypothetical protein
MSFSPPPTIRCPVQEEKPQVVYCSRSSLQNRTDEITLPGAVEAGDEQSVPVLFCWIVGLCAILWISISVNVMESQCLNCLLVLSYVSPMAPSQKKELLIFRATAIKG